MGGTLSLFGDNEPAQTEDGVVGDPAAPLDLVDVAVPVPVDSTFSYVVPEALREQVQPGVRLLIPFGGRKVVGVALGAVRPEVTDPSSPSRIKYKPILAVLDPFPVLGSELLGFLRALAAYYLAPIGEVMALALPGIERRTVVKLRAAGLPTAVGRIVPEKSLRIVSVAEGLFAPPKLGPKARAVFDLIRERGEVSVASLAEEDPRAADHVRALAAKGLVTVQVRQIHEPFFAQRALRDQAPVLSDEQSAAAAAILEALERTVARRTHELDPDPSVVSSFLLHGVTGSGKTEVYFCAIERALALGLGTLVLVPEIALTPQLVDRFRARFGEAVAVVHSALAPDRRHRMGKQLREGAVRVAIGARSALFAPVPDLGLVIVDEEHDPSFKQEEGVRYHARDGAMLRAHRAGAVAVLGSATPSLELVALARSGRVRELRLRHRPRGRPLPEISLLDLRKVGPGPSRHPLLSLPLHRAIERTLAAKEQVLLFLNRRGFAPAVICLACGELRRCVNCDVSLTWHREHSVVTLRDGRTRTLAAGLRCHHCDRVEPLPDACPKCGHRPLSLEGAGTERIAEVLAEAFPAARVARLDRDVASGARVEEILQRMRSRDVDILIGTQMVTKGHDLPDVTLVGVLNADSALSMPDFRAAERTFQQLVQVAGRAGRGDVPGSVFVQTRSPDHPAIVCALHHDVDTFVESELRNRDELGHPPFSRLVLLRLEGQSEAKTLEVAEQLATLARSTITAHKLDVYVLGPMEAPLARLRGRHRMRVLLRGARAPLRTVSAAIRRVLADIPRDIHVVIDVDPVSMM